VQTFLDGRVTLHIGDVRERLAAMPADSVDCVVTSPPYWGLRDYDVEGQIGLEPTLAKHLAVMVDVFEAVKRVQKPTGTLWLNYGDCYATTPNGRSAADTKAAGADDRTFRDKPFSTVGPIFQVDDSPRNKSRQGRSGNLGNGGINGAGLPEGRVVAGGYLKPKDLCMIPNRLAIALQDAGWWVRSEIVWGKTNPMPDSSGAQRPSTAHEKIFLLTKSDDGAVWRARDTGEISFCPDLTERCALITDPDRDGARWLRIGAYYDAETVRQGRTSDEDAATFRGGSYVGGEPGPRTVVGNKRVKMPDGWDTGEGGHGSRHRRGRESGKVIEVTPRHQGQINHTGLDELGRGSGRLLRNYEPAALTVWPMATQAFSDAHFATFPPELAERCILAGCPKGGLVLDPFGGAGTTALVALRYGRRAALIELNPDYAEMARRRIETEWRVPQKPKVVSHGPLFGEDAA
jgi:DNA modification methylase